MSDENAFLHITIGELLDIKKLLSMTIKEALPEMRKLRDKHGLDDIGVKNLIGIAKGFDYTMTIKRKVSTEKPTDI